MPQYSSKRRKFLLFFSPLQVFVGNRIWFGTSTEGLTFGQVGVFQLQALIQTLASHRLNQNVSARAIVLSHPVCVRRFLSLSRSPRTQLSLSLSPSLFQSLSFSRSQVRAHYFQVSQSRCPFLSSQPCSFSLPSSFFPFYPLSLFLSRKRPLSPPPPPLSPGVRVCVCACVCAPSLSLALSGSLSLSFSLSLARAHAAALLSLSLSVSLSFSPFPLFSRAHYFSLVRSLLFGSILLCLLFSH